MRRRDDLKTEGRYRQWYKSWFESPETSLLVALALMTLMGMTLAPTGPVKYIFWAFFVPVTIWILVRRGGARTIWRSVPLRWALVLLILYVISTTWSAPSTLDKKLQIITHAVLTMIFVAGTFFSLGAPREKTIWFAKLLVVACVLGAIVSIVGFYSDHSWAARLYSSPSLLRHPSLAPAVMVACLMVAGLLMVGSDVSHRGRWLCAGFVAVGAYVFFAQTRGVLLSYACLMILWGWFYLGGRKVLVVTGALVVILVLGVLMSHSLEGAWTSHLSTGLNGRLVIWKNVLREFSAMPWIGHGAASIFPETIGGRRAVNALSHIVPHPHGLYPSMLFYFGSLGALIMTAYLALLARGFSYCHKQAKWPGWSALICLILMTSMDVHILVAEVGREWWFWWLPTVTMVAVADRASLKKAT